MDEGNPHAQPKTLPLEYASGPPSPQVPSWGHALAVPLAFAWAFAMLLAGVGSDRIKLPFEKKIAFSISAGAVLLVMCFTGQRRRVRRALIFGFTALWFVAVMWFWN